MSTIVPSTQPQSPFDAITHTDEQGEHTTGRELMPLLGYRKWERFNDAVDMAYHVVVTEQGKTAADQHFSRYREATSRGDHGAGQLRENVRLTRYAAYLTAMRGDSRKPEIRAALIYFAVQTRIAETMSAPPVSAALALPPSFPVGTPYVLLDFAGVSVCATPSPHGSWVDATNIFFLFGFRSSEELAAWLPKDERERVRVPWGAGTLPLWVVSPAGMARLVRERGDSHARFTEHVGLLREWAHQGCAMEAAPVRRMLGR